MRLDDERQSSNIDDQRGMGGGGIGGGGRGPGFKVGGIGAIVLVVGALYFGIDPRVVLGLVDGTPAQTQQAPQMPRSPAGVPDGGGVARQAAASDPQRVFVAKILASTEDVWSAQFRNPDHPYHAPRLVLFTDAISSGCGLAQTATGPFYCPGDKRVYLDLAFFRELQDRLGARGDFARAYVIAHEVGHHVQDELGILQRVDQRRQALDTAGRNALSVKVELQADCLAGVWAKQADQSTHILEAGDVQQGIDAAAAVGDDRLQRAAGRSVSPDSFTHGSSAQRMQWFQRGMQDGSVASCDTFGRDSL